MLRRAMRLHQWAKNALVFVPLVLGGRWGDAGVWTRAGLGFAALGFAASATYLLNDWRDLAHDRRHPSKRHRPLASGDLSAPAAVAFAGALLAGAAALGLVLGAAAAGLLAAYVALSVFYSVALKRVPLLDIVVLAALFTGRLMLGIALADVPVSPWLLVFSMFLFASLSLAKRHTELLRTGSARGYAAADAPLLMGLGLGAMTSALLVLALYLIQDAFPAGVYRSPSLLWAAPVLLFLFLGRVWLRSGRGELADDPVAFALKDPQSLLMGVLMVLVVIGAVAGVGLP